MEALYNVVQKALQPWAPAHAKVLVATSGGPDSQALLHILIHLHTKLGWDRLEALGIDHGLRPNAASELALAHNLATAHGIPFHTAKVHVNRTGNLPEQARKARYQALHAHARAHGFTHIAVGHTASDQVETVLFRLARGSSPTGVAGIRPRKGLVIRPLLQLSRQQIMAYVEHHAIPYANDPSNQDMNRTRSYLRHTVAPLLHRVSPQYTQAYAHFAALAQQDDAFLHAQATKVWKKRRGCLKSLCIEGWAHVPLALSSRVLQRWCLMHGMRPTYHHMQHLQELVLHKQGRLSLPGGSVHVCYDHLWATTPSVEIPSSCTWDLQENPEKSLKVCAWKPFACNLVLATSSTVPTLLERNERMCVAYDADMLQTPLTVRPWIPGDVLQPFGSTGHTTVGDLFTDAKIPSPLRAYWPVVVQGDTVLWVVGLRRSAHAPITPKTKRVCTIHIEGTLPSRHMLSAASRSNGCR